jgi:hypothetical protein
MIEIRVMASTGENIQYGAAIGSGIQNTISGDQFEPMFLSEMNELLLKPWFLSKMMPLKLDKHAVCAETTF